MDQIIETFHIDVKNIIAQLVNFSIVFAILYFFAIKPMTKLMAERSEKIEKGLKNAEEFDDKIEALKSERAEVIANAKKEAHEIVAAAKAEADVERDASLAKTQEQVEKIISQAKEDVADIKEQTIREIKKESISMVSEVTGRVLGDVVDQDVDKKIIEKHLKEVK